MQTLGAIGLVLIWTGALSGLWNAAGNWSPATVPPSTAVALEFPASASRKAIQNDLDLSASQPLELRFTGSGYSVSGSGIPSCGIDASHTSGFTTIDAPILAHASCSEIELRSMGDGELWVSSLPNKRLVKTGTGNVRVGSSTTAEETRIEQGGFVVQENPGRPNSPVTIAGGALAGDGTVGDVTGVSGSVRPGGSLALSLRGRARLTPGEGAGELTTGDLDLNSSTTLVIEIENGFDYDSVTVNGSVDLDDTPLSVTLGYSPPPNPSPFTIVDNDGSDAIDGTFAGLAEGATFTVGSRSARISYVGGTGNDVTLTILPPSVTININPALPSLIVGQFFSRTLSASGGSGPYAFSVTGGALPGGVTLAGALLSGTPTTAGLYSFQITATDSLARTGTRTYSGVIGAASAITIEPDSLPAMRVGTPFTRTLMADGGEAPYTFAVTSGALPAGLTLASSGLLSGTPTAAGPYNFSVQATDSEGGGGMELRARTLTSAAFTYTGSVLPASALSIAPASLAAMTVGQAVDTAFTASGGTAPYTFEVRMTGGEIPDGLTLEAGGELTGTPTIGGLYEFEIGVEDALGTTTSRTYSVTVAAAVPAMPPLALGLLAIVLVAAARRMW